MRVGQSTFAGGELDPEAVGRTDIAQYANSVAIARNFFVKKWGGLSNRPGTRVILEMPDDAFRLLPFSFGSLQAYAMAVSDLELRLFTGGGTVQVEATDAVLDNGDFGDGLTGWTDESTGAAEVQLGTGTAPIDTSGATPLGNMTAGAGVAAAFDGDLEKLFGESAIGHNKSSCWVGLDWGSGNDVAVVGVRIWSASDLGFRSDGRPALTFRLEGSSDGFASSVVELGRITIAATGTAQIVDLVQGVDVGAAYRWHRIVMTGGSNQRNGFIAQVQMLEAVTTTGRADLVGAAGETAVLQKQMTTTDLDQEHVLVVTVEGEPTTRVLVRVGASSGNVEFLDDWELLPGVHSVAFTPGVSPFWLQFRNPDDSTVTVRLVRLLGSGALAPVPFVLPTPWPLGDLERLNWTQSRDTMTLVHPRHRPREMVRRGHLSWSLTPLRLTPDVAAPGNLAGTLSSGSGSTTHRYVVTAHRGGKESLPSVEESVGGAPATLTAANNVALTWAAVPTAERYSVYKYRNGLFGFIGGSEAASFTDDGINAAVDDTPPRARDPFADAGTWPAAVDYFEQRLAFAGGVDTPETGHLSRTADFRNFAVSEPLKDDDAITFVPAGRKMGEILHLLGQRSLLMFTSETVWSINRGDAGLTPALEGGVTPQDGSPSGFVPPLAIGRRALYVRSGGDAVLELGYELAADGFTERPLSLLAGHLIRQRRLKEWTWARRPWELVWGICDDGLMVSMTYDPMQQVMAWTRHETAGRFETVVAIDEGLEDVVYLGTRRRVGGIWRRFVEVMASRRIADVRDSYFVDCGLTYDEPHGVTAVALANPVALTVPGHDFTAGDLIDVVGLQGPVELNDRRYRVSAVAGETITLLTDIPSDPVADDFIDGTGLAPWLGGGYVRKARSTFYVPHLEGEVVAVLADGGEEPRRVAGIGGLVELQRPASRVHVGLPYASDILTLPLAAPMTVQGAADFNAARRNIKAILVQVLESRRLLAGPSFDRLDSYKPPAPTLWDLPEAPVTGMIRIPIEGRWTDQPRVAMRQEAPLPIQVLGIIPELTAGG